MTRARTLSIVQELKSSNSDFEWYPSTQAQIDVISKDIATILESHDFSNYGREAIRILDIGSGDGRVLLELEKGITALDKSHSVKLYGIEKATTHINSYRGQGIALLGTEFYQTNFISKRCDIAFVNPPYSEFSTWLSTLIMQLNFGVLYAIVPERWLNDAAINAAIKERNIKTTTVLDSSDFLSADRQARAKVQLVRFAFNDFEQDLKRREEALQSRSRREYYSRPVVGRNKTDPFQLFLDKELGLKQTHNSTTNKFHEHMEKERIRKSMETQGTESYQLVETQGVLPALLEQYDADMKHVLEQYKQVSALDGSLLAELGVEYKALREGIEAKLFGFRSVYWSLLFDYLEVLSSRLTSSNKQKLLDTLNQNGLDFTHLNATYIVSFAVDMANDLVQESIIEVFKELTSEAAIQRHYVSNEHFYSDRWRHNSESDNGKARYILDYRFVSCHHSNFDTGYWQREGLTETARRYTDDILVALKLLGYTEFETNFAYSQMAAGNKLVVKGIDDKGKRVDLLHIRFYKNGNRHVQFNQDAMLRLNCTASRLLGWVRSKQDFEAETGIAVTQNDWNIKESLALPVRAVLALTYKSAA